jgi:glycosyltransferase involved in cell wall biosynthesis
MGSFRFPAGDPAAARVLGIGKALRAIGYEVVFGGGEEEERPEDWVEASGYFYEGFPYISQGGLDRTGPGTLHRLLDMEATAEKTLRWIDGYLPRGVVGIIAYAPSTLLLWQLRKYTRRHSIPLILDLTEWPVGCDVPGARFGIRVMDAQFRLRFLNGKSDGVIAISSFLAEYYRNSGCPVVRIPPLVDLDDQKWDVEAGEGTDSLRLIYAGSPGKKDLLGNIIRGVLLPNRRRRRIDLHLVGVTEEEARQLSGCERLAEEANGAKVICHGRIAQKDVPGMLSRADFSVLLRPDNKKSRAGFATKLVESLSAGTPAIVNATSDIPEFVKDGQEGFIVRGSSPEALAATLNTVTELPREKLQEMKTNAKIRARRSFDYRNYCPELNRFLGTVLPRAMSGPAAGEREEVIR